MHYAVLRKHLNHITCRFQNKQGHHREQQTEKIEREGQRSRPQNASSGISGSNGATSVTSVNHRGPGFSRGRDNRDGDEHTRSEQQLCRNRYTATIVV